MVKFYKPAKNKTVAPRRQTLTVTIDEMDMYGQGISHTQQGVLFVEGALPGEICEVVVTSRNKTSTYGQVLKVLSPAPMRMTPFCPLIEECGGCQLQHAEPDTSLSLRQQALSQHWQNRLKLDSIPWQAPLTGGRPAYRRKARLAIDARDNSNFKMGYRAPKNNRIIDVPACPVLEPQLSALIAPLKHVLDRLVAKRHLGHVSLLAGDEVSQITIKLTRPADKYLNSALTEFAKNHQVNMVVENAAGEFETLHEQRPVQCQTHEGLLLQPMPNDFIQINAQVNSKMVAQAMKWLAPQKGDYIADWFSGLGNFSLSLAQANARVQAVEGVAEMVQRAQKNALEQGVTGIDWLHADLTDADTVNRLLDAAFTKVLLDPSREGARTACEELARNPVSKLLYISCNPNTFTRDAQYLLAGGFKMEKVGLVEMFPYTRHLELMALFTHKNRK